jgi:HTH-type transcriptional regulator/antitoxin HipB
MNGMPQIITNPGQITEILRGRRKALGISQHELATQLGLSQNRLSVLEGDASGMTLSRFLLLAKLLGLELVVQDKKGSRSKEPDW